MDQQRALGWVQTHVSQVSRFIRHSRSYIEFHTVRRDDQDHVMTYGASTGARSVAMQMTAFGGRDDHLFKGGIVQSAF